MRTELSVEIDRPIAEVFEYTTNHVAEWSLTVVEEEVLEEKPEGVGTIFRLVTEEQGGRMEFHGIVACHEPPTASAVHMIGQYFDIDVAYLFEDLSGRTRVTQTVAVTPKGFLKVPFFIFGLVIKRSGCKAQEKELTNLKRLLESRRNTVN